MDVSIVVPIYNERDNIPLLHQQLDGVLCPLGRDYEILLIDDGSTDGSDRVLAELAQRDPHVRVVQFRRNYGQTAAMQAGLQMASGEAVVTLDGDLQNDPADIPAMLAKLDEGFDLVHGWRKDRQDKFWSRRLPSILANRLISKVTGFPIHDLGCTLKAMRREIAHDLELYGEMHRFIPILAHQRGARCVEVVTRHHPRRFGQTKYGISRTLRVVLDLMTVKYLLSYFASPMKLFGMIGFVCGAGGAAALAAAVAMKLVAGVDMTGNPLLLASVLGVLVAMQFFSLGLLGEVNARIYFADQRQHYRVRRRWNFPADVPEQPRPEQRRAA